MSKPTARRTGEISLTIPLDAATLLAQAQRHTDSAERAQRIADTERAKAQRFRDLAARAEAEPVTAKIRTQA